ncbi:lantibiotic dehydratase family protein [Streptomyces sp. MRC013]|uniref:lantibiotic dehydratase n=1 Tax=Streptomyces sp. MRC013 TaxID=2898276 RepID=UPI002026ABE7|nr:lantibiotic dehydratase [Streptomyces sp. MRC013]URM92230.1 lantibiotic dehydratase family protein [Streptomyces sp. MRC013]
MTAETIGALALLRVAGMPCTVWTEAGAPALFDRVARHAGAAGRRAARARALAERVGAEVVPDARLSGAERGAVLALRRRLHAGEVPGPEDLRLLEAVPAAAAEAGALLADARRAREEERLLEEAVAAERARVAVRAWETARGDAVLRAFLAEAAPAVVEDVERRLARGESWLGGRLRKRTGYLWRVLGRMAAKTTPRGWAGHVAAVPVGEADGAGALLAGRGVLGGAALGEVENVHLVRAGSGPVDLLDAPPSTLLAPAPLHFTEGGPGGGPSVLRCWVVEPHAPERLRHVVLRRTGALERVLALLADGPVALGDVEEALLAPGPGGRSADPAVLRGFLRHLAGTGVLQVCAAPRRRYGAWSPPGAPPPLPAADAGAWFADVYRRADAVVGVRAADRVRDGVRVATRVAALREAGAARRAPEDWPVGAEPRPVGEVLAELLAPGGDAVHAVRRGYTGWAAADAPGGDPGYAALLGHLAARAGEERVDLDDALLDALGAPPADEALPPWPFDCLLRPLAGGPGSPVAVLETASPAGMLDARFADGMRALDGGYGAADAYRAFLAELERRTGVRFVEVLVPPLAERAANAVRRPVVTSWWTGDPDPTPYYGPAGGGARYLPLDRITVRTREGRLVAEADGRRIVPVHHATRGPVPPYDHLLRLLLAAGLPVTRRVVRLDGLEAALPGHARLPRLTVAGGTLVVAPATWRLDPARLWDPRDTALAKVRALALLRRSAGLPRHVFLRTAPGAKPVPADLDSVTAVPLVERLRARQAGGDLFAEEMLPGPDGLVLRDPLHGGAPVAAQVLLRLPHRARPEHLAARAAAALLPCGAPPGVPGPAVPRGRRTAGAVNTP